jgi:uncharacterized protein (TIGR02145 family)
MKKVNLILILFVCLGTISFSQTVTIGTQVWMTKNLDVDRFRNGDPIPEAKTTEEWENAGENKQPAWCYYDNDPKNGEKYGKLYNWYAVSDSRGLAPEGWHVPSNDEWTVLTDNLGSGYKIKDTYGWTSNGNETKSTNSSGFSGLPGGDRSYVGSFDFIGYHGYWWSSTEGNTNNAWSRTLNYRYGFVDGFTNHKGNGFSVRCLRD